MTSQNQKITEDLLDRLLADLSGDHLKGLGFLAPDMQSVSQMRVGAILSVAEDIVHFTNRWLANLKRQANALLSPTYRLPIELTHRILRTAMMESANENYYSRLRQLRLVSAHWSEVIDHLPSFWTKTSYNFPHHTVDMALRKSQSVPIQVNYRDAEIDDYFSASGDDDALIDRSRYIAQVSMHSHHWGSLSIDSADHDTVERFLQTPAPVLGTFRLSSDNQDVDESKTIVKSLDTFLGTSPQLHSVTILDWSCNWDFPALSRLRSLVLCRIRNNAPTTSDLVRIVSACPELHVLEIAFSRIVVTPIDPSSNIRFPVALQNLQSLKLIHVDAIGEATAELIRLILFPPSTQVELDSTLLTTSHLEAVGKWVAYACHHWTCAKTIEVKAALGGVMMDYGDGQMKLGISESRTSREMVEGVRFLLSHLNAARRAMTSMAILHFSSNQEAALDYVTLVDNLFPAVKQFRSCGASTSFISLLPRPISSSGSDRRWFFSAVEHLEIYEFLGEDVLVELIEARAGGAVLGEVARITTFKVGRHPEMSQANLDRLHELVPNLEIDP